MRRAPAVMWSTARLQGLVGTLRQLMLVERAPRMSVVGTVALGRRCSVERHCHSPRGGFNGVSSAKKG
jgi:hypothetical protein